MNPGFVQNALSRRLLDEGQIMATEFSTLSPLPGGRGRYITTLSSSVRWISQMPGITRAELIHWFVQQFNASVRSSSNYIHVLTRLDMIKIDELGRVRVTDTGRQLLELGPHEQIQFVTEFLLQHQHGLAILLALYADVRQPLHIKRAAYELRQQFPQWTHVTPFQHRALWLLSLDCLKQVKGRYYQITAYGGSVIQVYRKQHRLVTESTADIKLAAVGPAATSELSARNLLSELSAAAVDSHAPQRLQQAVARAFDLLGFMVEERGEAGNTDIIVRASIGPQSYTAIVDVKSRQDGKLRDISGFTLDEHRHLNQADYALVVAGEFGNGKLTREAEQHRIMLLSVQVLCEWLELHRRTPLSLLAYRTVFEQHGRITSVPDSLSQLAQQRKNWTQLLADVATVLEEVYDLGLSHAVTSEQLFGMLFARSHSVKYTPKQIEELLTWLAHPLIDFITFDDNRGVIPTRAWSSFRELQRWPFPHEKDLEG